VNQNMNGKDLIKLGFKPGAAIGVALRLIPEAAKHLNEVQIRRELKAVLENPAQHSTHPYFGELAVALREEAERPAFRERPEPAPYKIWGEGLEPGAVDQMKQAARLPVAVAGALMPDAHIGYGLPIGGVLATENAVIPYAVGVDIACRMKLSVFDIPAKDLQRLNDQLVRTLQRETKFGTGVEYQKPLEHEVLDEDWSVTPVTKRVFDKARAQLGTSGSGNHFVEFGVLTLDRPDLGLDKGEYLALLSHSGSRGSGATVADFYSRLARDRHPELPPELSRLAWLDLNSEEGQEYWAAMNLMGKYAAANHALIHKKIAKALGARVAAGVENHHNFCIPATERVPTPDGPVSIAQIHAGDKVYCFNPDQGLIPARVKGAWSTGTKPIYTIRTRHRKIRLTATHPVLTLNPEPLWVEAAQLRLGDRIVCAEGYYRRDGDVPAGVARFIGAFLGDGWVRRDTARRGYTFGLAIGDASQPHTSRYVALIESLPAPEVPRRTWKDSPLRLKVSAPGAYGISGSNKRLHQFICNMGLGVESTHRRVPDFMFRAPIGDKRELLAGYMDADGSIGCAARRDGSGLVRACNELLVHDLREIALSARLTCSNVRAIPVISNFGRTTCYGFNISPASMKNLDLWHERKRALVENAVIRSDARADLLADGVFTEKVIGISVSEEEEVFDLEVDHPAHCFVCEGVVVHNCWREEHNGRELYVHRKGATPAGKGVLGVIPGSMAAPGFVVRGRGDAQSLESASHGAGRQMSRTAAREKFRWKQFKELFERAGVQLLSAGIDEAPGAYKDIHSVMAAQRDLVDVIARFDPKIVKMADAGEKPED
jgi:tRNA-splicing ligase RtcB (3'-phosphate/5'-hydroxy nucleic acid ligase)